MWFIIGIVIALNIAFIVLVITTALNLSDNLSNKLRIKLGEAYQIIGYLAEEADLYDDPAVQKALDHFADPDKFLDDPLLPWYPESINQGGPTIFEERL